MPKQAVSTAIWWIRRDLRLHDNPALQAALRVARTIIPLFILDEAILTHSHERCNAFLFENLRELDIALRERGSRLFIRRGAPLDCLQSIFHESKAQAIFAQQDFSPYAHTRDKAVAAMLPFTLTPGVTIQPPLSIRKKDGNPYTIFTPYARAWREQLPALHLLDAPTHLETPPILFSEPVPSAQPSQLFPASEQVALQRLHTFLAKQAWDYQHDRDMPGQDSTSLLSPYFHFGVLSSRLAFQQAQTQAQSNKEAAGFHSWINELVWREFYTMILENFPHVVQGAFREQFSRIEWENNEHHFLAWQKGSTGYPLVDAGMRQLQETGWMHNRTRMIVASFLCKDLLINWQWGETFFYENLIDRDLASNNGGWQWSAGTGTDAAPYFRVFNPVTQSKRFDQQGTYIHQWLPELDNIPDKYLHTPWQMPLDVQQDCGCIIGKHYPNPLINHSLARQRALKTYRKVKA